MSRNVIWLKEFLLAKMMISKSERLNLLSIEAKCMAMREANKEIHYIYNFFKDMGILFQLRCQQSCTLGSPLSANPWKMDLSRLNVRYRKAFAVNHHYSFFDYLNANS
jgi:hypothetical protein